MSRPGVSEVLWRYQEAKERDKSVESSNIVFPDFGALVISLDFERHWGVRDKERVNGSYKANLEGEWEAITKILKTFREFEVAATWAIVGFLFADSREQMENHSPPLKPSYNFPLAGWSSPEC